MPPCTLKLMSLRCPASACLFIRSNQDPNKHHSRFNSTSPQLIVTPKTGLIDNQVRKTSPFFNFELQVNFLGEGFPSRALVELRADLRREEDKVHFSSTNRFFMHKNHHCHLCYQVFLSKIMTSDINYCHHSFPDS